MVKKYKIIISAVSLVLIVGIAFVVADYIKTTKECSAYLKYLMSDEVMYDFERLHMDDYKKDIIRYAIFATVSILSILAIGFFNFLLWFKQVFNFIPLTAEQKAERKKIIAENKKKKLQEKLNKLN